MPIARAARTTSGNVSRRKPASSGNALADKLARIGIVRDEDLVLHLPLRYEDHTRLVPLAGVQVGETVQTEGIVASAEIQYRPRRQFVCLLREADGGDERRRAVPRREFSPPGGSAAATAASVGVQTSS